MKQFQRYLPTLQLKKQQLQMEILHQLSALREKEYHLDKARESARAWAGILSERGESLTAWLTPEKVNTRARNIAGLDIPVFDGVTFPRAEYDLFYEPLWLDRALEELRKIATLMVEVVLLQQGLGLLRQELRITTQRVNLFEKVKIPEAKEAIRQIKIYLGDQMANAVGRSKIAKRKIEALLAGAGV